MTKSGSQIPSSRRLELGVWELALAAAYAAAHLPFLAPALEDIDSINFALGLRDFNPAEHQPHPPGYPVYIAAGRAVVAAVRLLRPDVPQVSAEALALSFLSAIAGAAAILLAAIVFRALAREATPDEASARRTARWAAALLAVSPLFWITGVRPLSDMPGLAAAFGAQALMLSGRLTSGALLAGMALGVRSQTLMLTAPLLLWQLVRAGDRRWRRSVRALAAAALGALAWGIPMLVATGGLEAYLAALGSQAGEDFAFVDMLWANPTPRRLAFGLFHTLVLPWARLPLAVIMLVLGALGAVLMLVRRAPAFATLVVAFAPYAAFHLVFQETITVRYALPVLAPIVFLAARGLAALGRGANFVAAPVVASLLLAAMPGLLAYGRDPHPAFRAVADARRRAEARRPGMLTSHYELRRPLQAAGTSGLPVTWAPRHREWLELANYWRGGGREPAWFLANPRRTDLALIDPHSRTDVVRYRWAAESRPELSGTRPIAVDWYRLNPPGWFLMTGWSLTPETGGLTQATGAGPGRTPIEAYVQCRPSPMHLLIGVRQLREAPGPAASISLAHEDRVLETWTVPDDDRNLLEFVQLPDGLPCPAGKYTRVLVSATGDVAVRQFDVQPASRFIFGYAAGWHEAEYAAETGLLWRWTSDRAVMRVHGPMQPVRVRMRGESPLKYFDEAPTVTLSAAGRVFGRIQPAADFQFDVTVPADAVQAAGGDLVIETTRSFVPANEGASADMRRLGLRIFDVRVERAR